MSHQLYWDSYRGQYITSRCPSPGGSLSPEFGLSHTRGCPAWHLEPQYTATCCRCPLRDLLLRGDPRIMQLFTREELNRTFGFTIPDPHEGMYSPPIPEYLSDFVQRGQKEEKEKEKGEGREGKTVEKGKGEKEKKGRREEDNTHGKN